MFSRTIILMMLKLFWIAFLLGIPISAQVAVADPIETTITDLSLHAKDFDGHLVHINAVLVLGWEGDNFLLDPSKPAPVYMPSRDPASIWFYCNPIHEKQVYAAIGQERRIYGSFKGYFHWVEKPRIVNGLFDPGSLQFEAVEASVPEQQTRSLAAASVEGDVDTVRSILQIHADMRNKYGSILLFLAANTGRDDFAQELLASGADPRFAAPGGETSLMNAAWNCEVDVAKTLLSHGALVNAANVNGETAVILASRICRDGKMVQLLLEAGANPNAKTTNGVTPLIAAAGNPINAAELLKAGANPSIKTDSGETVETESCDRGEEGHYQVCQLVRGALRSAATHTSKP